MKRLKKPTIGSIIFAVLGMTAMFFFFTTASTVFGVVMVIGFALSYFLRRRESIDSYKDRYEEKYGLNEQDEEQGKKES